MNYQIFKEVFKRGREHLSVNSSNDKRELMWEKYVIVAIVASLRVLQGFIISCRHEFIGRAWAYYDKMWQNIFKVDNGQTAEK